MCTDTTITPPRLQGDFLSYNYQVVQLMSGGRQRVVASVHTDSPFSSGGKLFNSMVLGTSTYRARIEPGVDAAFVLALVMLAEENMGERHDMSLLA